MQDRELIDAFLTKGAQRGFGESLHIEGDVLIIDGWWHVCLRMSQDAFVLRAEEPPSDTTAMDDIASALAARGLKHVATDLPGITVLTMTKASLGFVSWDVWAVDLESGKAALAAGVNEDSFLQHADSDYYDPVVERDYSSELHGARRLAGLPTSLILTVGVAPDSLSHLGEALEDCHFIVKAFGEIEPDVCGSLVPTLILVDATEQRGRDFVMQLRSACSRMLPVVAVTPGATTPLGADSAVASDQDPRTWAPPIRTLLP